MCAYRHLCTHDLGTLLRDLGSFCNSCPCIILGEFFDNDEWEPAIWWLLSNSYREGAIIEAIIEAKQDKLSCAENGNLKNDTSMRELHRNFAHIDP